MALNTIITQVWYAQPAIAREDILSAMAKYSIAPAYAVKCMQMYTDGVRIIYERYKIFEIYAHAAPLVRGKARRKPPVTRLT